MFMILFDLDGTILDTLDDITNAVNYTLNNLSLENLDKNVVRKYLGYGARKLLLDALGENNKNLIEEALKIYLPYLAKNSEVLTKPYEKISLLLENLQGHFTLGVVSNKPQEATSNVISKYFPNVFDIVIGQTDGILAKPSPDMVYIALDEFGYKAKEAIYIGDSEVDILTAKNASMKVIAVSWGFRSKEDLKALNPDYLVDSPEELLKVIEGLI